MLHSHIKHNQQFIDNEVNKAKRFKLASLWVRLGGWFKDHYKFLSELVDKKHWCFSKKGLAGLRIFLGEQSEIPIPETNINAIIHLIKLMSHKNTD